MNNQLGRIGVMTRLQRLNRAHRTLTTDDNGLLIAEYKTSPVALQEQWEDLNTLIAMSMMDSPEQQLQTYQNEVDDLATNLLSMKDDLDYQEIIIEFVSTYPQYRELFE